MLTRGTGVRIIKLSSEGGFHRDVSHLSNGRLYGGARDVARETVTFDCHNLVSKSSLIEAAGGPERFGRVQTDWSAGVEF